MRAHLEGVGDEGAEEGEVSEVALWVVVGCSGGRLDDDRAEKVRSRNQCSALAVFDRHALAPLQCLGAAADLDRGGGADGSEIGSFAEAIWTDHVDTYWPAAEAVGDVVWAHSGRDEPVFAEGLDERWDCGWADAGVNDEIEVLTDSTW